jgi:hypothetical protein
MNWNLRSPAESFELSGGMKLCYSLEICKSEAAHLGKPSRLLAVRLVEA